MEVDSILDQSLVSAIIFLIEKRVHAIYPFVSSLSKKRSKKLGNFSAINEKITHGEARPKAIQVRLCVSEKFLILLKKEADCMPIFIFVSCSV